MDAVELDQIRVVLNDQTRLVMALLLFGMMFTVALSLRREDFEDVAREPLRVAAGSATQILGLPLLTLGLILILNPPASVALGMIVVASCPGGNMSNLLTHFSRGNAAYSVSLTTVSSVLAALVTPVSIIGWTSIYPPTASLIQALDINPFLFISQTFALLAAPLALGMFIAARAPRTADRLRAVLTPASLVALAGVVVVGVYGNWALVIAAGTTLIPIAVLHNASAFGLGSIAGRVLGLDRARRRSLTFEVGIQNTGLGLLILLNQFDGLGGAAAITALWSVWHLMAGSGLVGLFRTVDSVENRRNRTRGAE